MRKISALCALCAVSFAVAACTVRVRSGDDPPPPPPPAQTPAATATAQTTATTPAQTTPPAGKLRIKRSAVFRKNSRGEVELPNGVIFNPGTATLAPESDAVLDLVHQYLQAKPEVTKLRIEGHTDTDGNNAENMQLSKDRAMAVAAWLVAKGDDCKRLVPAGFGEEKLLVTPENTEDDKLRNRRVAFVDAEVNGELVGGLPLNGGPPGEDAGDPCK